MYEIKRNNTNNALRRTVIKPKVVILQKTVNTTIPKTVNSIQRTTHVGLHLKPTPHRQPPQPSQSSKSAPVIQPRTQSVLITKNKQNHKKNNIAAIPKRRELPQITYLSADLTHDQVTKIKKLKDVGQGQYLVILGNGPSLNMVDTNIFKQYSTTIKLCTINVPDRRCWPTQYWAFYDRSQYNRHKDEYRNYSGIAFNSTGIKEQNVNSIKFKHIPGLGYSKDISSGIYVGMSSVFATIQIAMYMNFNRIYIIGCDMDDNVDSGMTHFYGINPDVNPDERKKRFKKEANWYNKMIEILSEEEKKKIVFCSKGINKWPFTSHFTNISPDKATKFIIEDTNNAS